MANSLAASQAKRKMHNESLKKASAARRKRKAEAEKNGGWYTKAVKKQKRKAKKYGTGK